MTTLRSMGCSSFGLCVAALAVVGMIYGFSSGGRDDVLQLSVVGPRVGRRHQSLSSLRAIPSCHQPLRQSKFQQTPNLPTYITFTPVQGNNRRLDPVNVLRRGGGGRGRINRKKQYGPAKENDGLISNEGIRYAEVRVIDEQKNPVGVMATGMAIQQARGKSMDLILVNPQTDPPLCRIQKLEKYRYELKRAEKEKSKQQRASRVEIKELKLRPNTDVHDYQVRLKKAKAFLDDGDRVKISCQFRGREMAFKNQGEEVMNKFKDDLQGLGVTEPPKMNGKTMIMMISPVKSKKEASKEKQQRVKSGNGEASATSSSSAQDTQQQLQEQQTHTPALSGVALVPEIEAEANTITGGGLVDLDIPDTAQGQAQQSGNGLLKPPSPPSTVSSAAAAAAAAATEALYKTGGLSGDAAA